MPTYLCKSHIRHGVGSEAKLYAPGDTIELTLEEARGISHALEPFFHKEQKPEAGVVLSKAKDQKGIKGKNRGIGNAI